MRSTVFSITLILIFSGIYISAEGIDPIEGRSNQTRSVSFIDIGETAFDQTSAPSFISAGDWNSDGYDDLLFNGHRLMKNNGPPNFDFTYMPTAFNSSVSGAANGAWADWDGDNDLDLYQGCGKGVADRFWENQGAPDFTMEDISSTAFSEYYSNIGPCTGASWGDFNGDGALDLYVGNGEDWNDGDPIYYEDHLLINVDSQLVDPSYTLGVHDEDPMYTRGVTWGDYNNDGRNDLYVSHYRLGRNFLYERGDYKIIENGEEKNCSGTYDTTWYEDNEAARVYGQKMWGPTYGHTIGSSWADFNRDGNLDLWTSDFVHKYVGYIGSWYDIRGYVCDDGNLYINDGSPEFTFTDYRNTSGIPIWPIGGAGVYQGDQTFSGISIGDLNNDGWEDMYIPQVYGDLPYTTPHLFMNNGYVSDPSIPDGTTFQDVASTNGISGANTYACLLFDHDNDGDLDIVTGGGGTWDGSENKWKDYRVRLYDNQGTGDNRYLRIKLNGTDLNKDAIGARVTLWINGEEGKDQILVREVRAGTGHAHQQSNVLHFGLGDSVHPEMMDIMQMMITWPDGINQWVRINEADTTIYVDYPTGTPPAITSHEILPEYPSEDVEITLNVTAGSGTGPIRYYLWDTDSDNIYDNMTTEGSIDLPPLHNDQRYVRCQVIGGEDLSVEKLGSEIYEIWLYAYNDAPVIELDHGYEIDIDSEFFFAEDTISDTYCDLPILTYIVDWDDGTVDEGVGHILPSHVYKSTGRFRPSIQVSDESITRRYGTYITVNNVAPWGWIEVVGHDNSTFTEDVWIEFFPHVFDTPSDDSKHVLTWYYPPSGSVSGKINESIYLKFSKPGQSNVSLKVEDEYDGVVYLKTSVIIENVPPGLVLIPGGNDVLEADEDELIRFDMLEGVDNESDERDNLQYHWTFGDGNQSESWEGTSLIHHTYERSGEYTALCMVKDNDDAISSYEIQVTINNVIPRILDVDIKEQYLEDESIHMNPDVLDSMSDIHRMEFEVETDGASSIRIHNEHIYMAFFKSGTYEVRITVTDDDGATSEYTDDLEIINKDPSGTIASIRRDLEEDDIVILEPDFLHDTPSDLANLTIEWKIDGETDRIRGERIEYAFKESGVKKVTMVISDGDSTTYVEKILNIKNPIPIARFEVAFDREEPLVGDVMIFDASASTDNPSDMDSLEYLWDLDNGDQLTGKIVNYSFDSPGTYHIVLTVTDDDNDHYSESYDLEIMDPEGDGMIDSGQDTSTIIISTVALILIALIGVAVLLIILIMKKQDKKNAEVHPIGSSLDGARLHAPVQDQKRPHPDKAPEITKPERKS